MTTVRIGPSLAAKWLLRQIQVEPGCPPAWIARALGIEVVYKPLSPLLSGLLVEEAPDSYLIIVNVANKPERQRFTIAHDIGHYILHRHFRERFVCGPRVLSWLEREANRFVVELLKPTLVFQQVVPRMHFTILSDLFGVSYQALEIRLRETRLEFAVGWYN